MDLLIQSVYEGKKSEDTAKNGIETDDPVGAGKNAKENVKESDEDSRNGR